MENDCPERMQQGRLHEREYGQNSGTKHRGLERHGDGLMCLLAGKQIMMMTV